MQGSHYNVSLDVLSGKLNTGIMTGSLRRGPPNWLRFSSWFPSTTEKKEVDQNVSSACCLTLKARSWRFQGLPPAPKPSADLEPGELRKKMATGIRAAVAILPSLLPHVPVPWKNLQSSI